jgi:hypothetical protein
VICCLVNSELLNATASDTYRTVASHVSSGIYDFPMRPTIKPMQMKRNVSLFGGYIFCFNDFWD